ncbi:MAG: hypothetical protein HY701_11890, partial [Gemmatimonadetes bacterium]|nr:hypothetical protein [Gemmatimonadota bacterium]
GTTGALVFVLVGLIAYLVARRTRKAAREASAAAEQVADDGEAQRDGTTASAGS